MKGLVSTAICAAILSAVMGAAAADRAVDAPAEGDEEGAASTRDIGVTVGLVIASAYDRRGLNWFQESSQHDRNGVLSPSLRWSILASGLWLRYAGYFQFTGDNQSYNVNMGRGHEQVLSAGWELAVARYSSFSLQLSYYFFPFAMKEMTGTINPSYLEPAVALRSSPRGLVDLRLDVTYYCGLQTAIDDERYFFLNPSIRKRYGLTKLFAFEGGLGFGYKLFTEHQSRRDNRYDIDFFMGVPISLAREMSFTPEVHVSWTDLNHSRPGEQYFVWYSVDLNVSL